jgi:hypothetical protein
MKVKRKNNTLGLTTEQSRQAADIALLKAGIRTWRRRAIALGLLLLSTIALVVPFSDGHAFHGRFGATPKILVYTSMCFLSALMYAVGTAYNLRTYHRKLKQIYGQPQERSVRR